MAIIQFRNRESRGRGNLLQSPNKFTYCRNLMFFPRIHVRQSRTVGSSAAYKFANMKFHDFPGPGPKFHDFPGLESKLSNSMTFQVFQDRYEPCFIRFLVSFEVSPRKLILATQLVGLQCSEAHRKSETKPFLNGFFVQSRLLGRLHLNVFNTGMPTYFIPQWPSTAGLRQWPRDCATNWPNVSQRNEMSRMPEYQQRQKMAG